VGRGDFNARVCEGGGVRVGEERVGGEKEET
jgi:hypothetical protein